MQAAHTCLARYRQYHRLKVKQRLQTLQTISSTVTSQVCETSRDLCQSLGSAAIMPTHT